MELNYEHGCRKCQLGRFSIYTDEKVISTAYKTFKQLWDEGHLQGERIVNYCTVHHTSFADIEVEHKNEK